MGCRILGNEGACFYDSVTMTAFGNVMSSVEEAEEFMKWLNRDPRLIATEQFEELLNEFREEGSKEI